MPQQFTDNLLGRLYSDLLKNYNILVNQKLEADAVCNILQQQVVANLTQNKNSLLYGLSEEDQRKALTVLNTFIQASPLSRESKQPLPLSFEIQNIEILDDFKHRYNCCYCPNHDTLFTWLLVSAFMNSAHSHTAPSEDCGDGKALAIFILIALAVVGVVLSLIALYYLLQQTLNSAERFWFNEGWLQAALPLVGAIGSGCAVGLLSFFLLASPIAALALAAGISNPVGILIASTICLTIVGAAVGCGITNLIQNQIITFTHRNALDPKDPSRYQLSQTEENNLKAKGLDPIKVKCAIAALRLQLEDGAASLMYRLFTPAGQEKQEILSAIRKLRKGEIENGTTFEWDDFKFDLAPFPYSSMQTQPEEEKPLLAESIKGVA